jgi:hypothetical protein
MPQTVRSEGWPTLAADDAVVESIAAAQLATAYSARTTGKQAAVDAWHHVGVVCANHLIDTHHDRLAAELAEVEQEWNTPGRVGPHWLALVGGYRDTLREYAERGSDV